MKRKGERGLCDKIRKLGLCLLTNKRETTERPSQPDNKQDGADRTAPKGCIGEVGGKRPALELQTKSWVARINESVLSFPSAFSTMQLSKLDPYCKTGHDGEPCLELSGLTAVLKRFVPEPA